MIFSVKTVVDIVTRRPQHLNKVETSRMELDEVSTPAFERVMQELHKLSRMARAVEKQQGRPH